MVDQIDGQRTTYLRANNAEEAAGFGLEWNEKNPPVYGVLAYDGEKTIVATPGEAGQGVARVFDSGDEIFEPLNREGDGSRGAGIPIFNDGADKGHIWVVASAQNDEQTIAHNHKTLSDDLVDINAYEVEHGAYPGGEQTSWTVHAGNEDNVGAVATPEQALALLEKATGIPYDRENPQIIYSDKYLENHPEVKASLAIPEGVVDAVELHSGGETLDLDAILSAGSPATPAQEAAPVQGQAPGQ